MIGRLVCLVRPHDWRVRWENMGGMLVTEWCCRRCGRCLICEGYLGDRVPPKARR